MGRVRLGYFEDFKSSNTLLMEADAVGLRALAQTFRSLAAGDDSTVAIHQLPFLEVHHGVRLTAQRAPRDRGVRQIGVENIFAWERTEDGWLDAAEKVEVLIHHDFGHHYLEGDTDEVVVQVSKGEYGDDWWLTHG